MITVGINGVNWFLNSSQQTDLKKKTISPAHLLQDNLLLWELTVTDDLNFLPTTLPNVQKVDFFMY